MSLIPLIPFALAIVILILIAFINIVDSKIHQTISIIALVNAVVFLVYMPFYDRFIEQQWFYITFITHIAINALATTIIILFLLIKVIFFKQHYNIFLNSIKNTKNNAYFVVNKKGRIKEMSESILEELGFEFKDVKGKNIFNIFNKSIRITHFDNIETNNRSLEVYYEDYNKEVKKNQIDTHTLVFQNYKGQSVLMRLVEQPLFIFKKYRGRINIGEKQSDFNLLEIEQKLKQSERDLESLRLKYIATMEIVDKGLYYIDLDDKSIWASEQLVKSLKLSSQVLNFEDFQSYIHPDDEKSYLGSLSNLTTRKDTFKTRYRFMSGGQYIWISDTGKRIFEDQQSNLILGSIEVIDASGYSKTGLETLDNLKSEKHIVPHLSSLMEQNKTFELALFHLANIPEINSEYGREVGNMLLSEYVKKLTGSFMSESSDIFRLTGITFAVTIVDPRKMSILKSGVASNPAFLNLKMNYGVIQAEVEGLMGVSASPKDAKTAQELLDKATQALNLARHKDYKGYACYYSDIND